MKESFKEKLYSFKVPKIDSTRLIADAVIWEERYLRKTIDLATLSDSKLNHILVNYVRHQVMHGYNEFTRSRSFQQDQTHYFHWFKAVNHEIGQVYPFLQRAAAQQISAKGRNIFKEEV